MPEVSTLKLATSRPRRPARLRLLMIRRAEGVTLTPHLRHRTVPEDSHRLHRVVAWTWWRPARLRLPARLGRHRVPPLARAYPEEWT